MARVGRIAGALLVETGNEHYMVGHTKEPCAFHEMGFDVPPEIDAAKRPWVRLQRSGDVSLGEPHLIVGLEGEAVVSELARRMLIERNGSVSERLWRLALGVEDPDDAPRGGVPARWLIEVPEAVWRVVREAVLRCV